MITRVGRRDFLNDLFFLIIKFLNGIFFMTANALTNTVGAALCLTLGAVGGVLGWYITSPSQGHGQSTWQKPTWYIASSFRMFPASFPAVSLGQEMVSTFTMSQVM